MTGFISICFQNNKKLSAHIAHISQQFNPINHKIYSYDQISKIIVNLASKKGDKNDDSYAKLTHIKN